MIIKEIKKIGVVACLIAAFGMASCTPDEKEEFSLVGKTYAATKYGSSAKWIGGVV